MHHRGAIRLPHTSHSGLKDRTLISRLTLSAGAGSSSWE
ncbi:hypothetical protein DPEC_G00373560 [Dallia pectoralis]|nr:hypothetical protein DPEC_G00373560 [Dallia pectoralis]